MKTLDEKAALNDEKNENRRECISMNDDFNVWRSAAIPSSILTNKKKFNENVKICFFDLSNI